MQIIAKDLKYVYNEKSKALATAALNGVSITINSGEFFGIVGKTGSGKSTFVQHLNGLIIPQKNSGSLMVGEFDLCDKKCDFTALRKKVSMVFQYPEYQLFAETVFLDVAYALKNFSPELSDTEVEQKVKNAINLVGLDYEKIKDKSPFELSGGQKRRVAIAGAIVYEPEVLVLDEPAAGLDPKGKKDFLKLLLSIHSTFVKTIVIVSHDMDLICEYCSSVAVFDGGEIIASGTPKEIFLDKELISRAELELPLIAHLTLKLNEKRAFSPKDLTVKAFVLEYQKLLKGDNR